MNVLWDVDVNFGCMLKEEVDLDLYFASSASVHVWCRGLGWQECGASDPLASPHENEFELAVGEGAARTTAGVTLWPVPGRSCVVIIDPANTPGAIDAIIRAERLTKRLFPAFYDHLTGLPNRVTFEQTAREWEGRIGDESDSELWVVSADVDNFKDVNDNYGHDVGDIVLRTVAHRIRAFLNDMASRDDSGVSAILPARLGGEEFVFLVRCRTRAAIHGFSKNLVEIVKNAEFGWAPHIHGAVTEDALAAGKVPALSVGCARCHPPERSVPPPSENPVEATLQRADLAMYRAKALGKDQVVFFDEAAAVTGLLRDHFVENGIVVIDIGRAVGVQAGDTYNVHHPDFADEKEYVHSTERSSKKLGKRPHVPSAVIEVFEVRPEIAFARVIRRWGDSLEGLSRGSRLTRLPRRPHPKVASTSWETIGDAVIALQERHAWQLEFIRLDPLPFLTEWNRWDSAIKAFYANDDLGSTEPMIFRADPKLAIWGVLGTVRATPPNREKLEDVLGDQAISVRVRTSSTSNSVEESPLVDGAYATAVAASAYFGVRWDMSGSQPSVLARAIQAMVQLSSESGFDALVLRCESLRAAGVTKPAVAILSDDAIGIILRDHGAQRMVDRFEWLEELNQAAIDAGVACKSLTIALEAVDQIVAAEES